MFGYVTIYKPELKIKDYYKYKSYYCGLCRTLKEEYGLLGQITLTYDMTFLIILLTSLYENDTKKSSHRCLVHPMKKHEMLQNEITHYGADMNLLLSYYHFLDNWQDEKNFPSLAGSKMIHRKIKKVKSKYKRQCLAIEDSLHKLHEYEAMQSTDLDAVSGCFGKLMEELFIYRNDSWEEPLRRLGFFLGKFIYLMDAYDDLEEDLKKEHYNPLKKLKKEPKYEENIRQILIMMIGECTNEFEKLPCILDNDILQNILYAGVWTKYNNLQRKDIDYDTRSI